VTSTNDKTKISKILEKLNKNFGDVIFSGVDSVKFKTDVIPCPSYALGDAIGYWGIPRGHITQFYGNEGSGKTFLAMLQVKEAQLLEENSVQIWIDAEFSFNTKWAKKLGIDLDRVVLIKENNGAQAFAATFGEPGREGVVDTLAKAGIIVNLIVLDSIAALIPPVEEERKFSDQNMAALARFLPFAFRVALNKIAKHNIAMIAINQARDVPGARVPTITCPGGRAYKHICSVNIQFATSLAKDATMFTDDTNEKKLGHKVNITVEKTRDTTNRSKIELWLNFNEGVAKIEEELANLGVSYGVISRPNAIAWVWKDVKVNGKENFYKFLQEDPKAKQKLLQEITEAREAGATRVQIDEPTFESLAEDDT
jgi:recombination protein RecA